MHLKRILYCNLAGIALFASWLWFSVWLVLDDDIFWFFNQFITSAHPVWVNFLAVVNTRYFDAASFVMLLAILGWAVHLDRRPGRFWRWLGVSVTMLITAGLLALATNKLPYGHPSPTLSLDHVNFLTDVVSFDTKDAAKNSFPGDHGLMLMVFTAFILRFGDRRPAVLSAIMIAVLSAPRVMAGAHWLQDVYMGSLAIALVVLPWVLCTPIAPGCVGAIERLAARLHLPGACHPPSDTSNARRTA
ncbi:lipid-A kinase [Kushneria avicenniae]|uniref:Lipid-A kinase n=1 Tax=Kushneria avicenniae TaxID=402385 RepID=A0A1I1LDF4_9GAMM|nr:phosphatase PAP2 family protein [Kushneria avicenniae]SFC67560.1 lipid-A kinase [Kushneria avicenniae]